MNDLHNWYPDVLYNPGRFRNVQDLLEYIRQGADTNPYTRGLQFYNARQRSGYPPTAPTTTSVSPAGAATAAASYVPRTATQAVASDSTYSPMSAATSLLAQLFSPNILQNFLNQTVVVSPSEEDINRATVASTASNTQEDICTICQDAIEEGQNMRKINHCNHYFHQDCIDTWFQGNVHCPTCRYDIRETTNPNEWPCWSSYKHSW